MDVVVVGAGIGGLAAARACSTDGHDVVVLEEATALRAAGGAVTLWPATTARLLRLGVDASTSGRVLDRMERRSPTGERLLRLDLARAGRALGSPVVTAPRGLLVEGLAPDGAEAAVRTGSRCVGVRGTGDDVAALLADGTEVAGDVLVGADGTRSVVRVALHGEDRRPTGATTWQLSPRATGTWLDDAATCLLLVGPAGMLGLNPCGGGRVQVWWDVRARQVSSEPPAALLRRLFGGWSAPEARAALALLDDDVPVGYARSTSPVHRPWGRDRVTLLGDAAHAVPPSLAQGVNQALADVAVLRRTLRGTAGAGAAPALRRYERASLRRVAVVSEVSRREPSLRVVPPAVLRVVPDALAGAGLGAWLHATGLGRDHDHDHDHDGPGTAARPRGRRLRGRARRSPAPDDARLPGDDPRALRRSDVTRLPDSRTPGHPGPTSRTW